MTDELDFNELTEAEDDVEELVEADASEARSDVSADADDSPVHEPILGATPAETPDEVSAVDDVESPQEKYDRLLDEGYKRSQLVAVTNGKGELIEVRIA